MQTIERKTKENTKREGQKANKTDILLEHGEFACLAADEHRQLAHHDAEEVAGLRRRQNVIARREAVAAHNHRLVGPHLPQACDVLALVAVVFHIDDIAEETSERSQHTHLRVRIGDHFQRQQRVGLHVARRPHHQVRLGVLVRKRDRREHIGAQINAQNQNGADGQRHAEQKEGEERRALGYVRAERVGDALLQVVIDQPTCARNLH